MILALLHEFQIDLPSESLCSIDLSLTPKVIVIKDHLSSHRAVRELTVPVRARRL